MSKNPGEKLAEKINSNIDIIDNAFQLALIKTDVDLPDGIPVKPVSKIVVDEKELWDFFSHYELNTFLQSFSDWTNLFQYTVGVLK
jgi:hypothetical protein